MGAKLSGRGSGLGERSVSGTEKDARKVGAA